LVKQTEPPLIREEIKEIDFPCWLFDEQLNEMICCNEKNGISIELEDYLKNNKNDVLDRLNKEGLIFFGNKHKYTAYNKGGEIFIQDNSSKDYTDNLEIQADISEELNKVLKKEIALHQQTQEKLKEHSAKLDAIFDSTALYIWTLRGDGVLTSFNRIFQVQMKSWFGREMIIGKSLIEDPYEDNIPEWVRFQEEMGACLEGSKKNIELKLNTESGEEVWVEIYMDPIKDPDTEEIKEVSCIGFEITDKKIINDQINQSLKEKETLLQEVHHRVKNNLQIISSLLNLQSSYVNDGESLEVLKESQNRIKSMSFIHESLYMSKNFSSVDIREYVKGLSSNLLYSYSLNPEQVDIIMDIDELTLNIDQAIPCGLIINELLSNTFKHAFPNGQKGELKISVKEKDGRMAILIADNGVGIPKDWKLEDNDSLGVQLVYTLTEQIDGDIEFSGERGTKYLITFDRIKNQ
jgi:PAS domain S-box-containing protein